MPVRELGAIAARVLAILSVLKSLPMLLSLSMTLRVGPEFRQALDLRSTLAHVAIIGSYFLIAGYLWFRAPSFWPSEQKIHIDINATELRQLAFCVAGLILIVLAVPELLGRIVTYLENPRSFDESTPLVRLFYFATSAAQIAIGIWLVVANRFKPVEYETES